MTVKNDAMMRKKTMPDSMRIKKDESMRTVEHDRMENRGFLCDVSSF